MENFLSSMGKMQRLARICPEVHIAPVLEEELWKVVLPKTAGRVDSEIMTWVKAEFTDVTFDRVIEKAWGILTSINTVIFTDGRLPWESIMVLEWDPDADDWKNLPEPSIPIFKLATYKPKS